MKNELEVINRIKKGEKELYAQLVNTYHKQIIQVCFQFTNNYTDAHDVAQTSFIDAYENLNKFKQKSSFYTWLVRIAINNALRFNKKKNKFVLFDFVAEYINPTHFHINNSMEKGELKAQIRRAVNSLSTNQKTAFILYYYHDLPYKKIAEVMQVSISSVESVLFRAKRNLRKKMIDYRFN